VLPSDWNAALIGAQQVLEREQLLLDAILAGDQAADVGTEIASDCHRRGVRPSRPHSVESDTVLIPVILEVQSRRPVPEHFQGIRASCLVRLRVEAQLLYRRALAPELTMMGPADPSTIDALTSATRLLGRARSSGAPALGHYWFRVHWDLPGARLRGRSATLGYLLAARTAHSSFTASLSRRAVAEGVAVTGDVVGDRIGTVDSIAEKVSACFFGRARLLVVPAQQREEALKAVRVLEQRYPRRQLLVFGARRMDELWGEPAVLVTRARSGSEILRVTLQRVAVSRGLVTVLLAVFILLAGYVGRELWLERPWPVEVNWDADDLVFRNASGRPYFRAHLAPGARATDVQAFHYRAGKIAAALDLDGEPPQEVAVIRWNPDYDGNSLEARDGRGRLHWRLGSQVGLPGASGTAEQLLWRFFGDAGREQRGKRRLLAVRRSLYGSLSLVDLVDGRTGVRQGLLANQGHLGRMFAYDVDADLAEDLLIGGTENPESKGLLVVVDPRAMRMPSSDSTLADVDWMTRPATLNHGVRAAIRLPKDGFLPRGRPECVEGVMENGRVLVTTETEGPARSIVFTLDLRNMLRPRVERVLITDVYRNTLATQIPALSEQMIAAEQERLSRSVTFLTHEGWMPMPTTEEAR